jgi:hypothetical protein
MKRLKMIFAVCLTIVAFNACQKNEVATPIDEVALSKQDNQAEETLADVDLLVDEAVDLNVTQLKSATLESSIYLGDCTIVTINKTVTPQVLTIDFGTSCTGKDGKIRSGKIIVTSASFNTFPSVRSKSFENYFVDGRKIEGSIVKTISKDQVNNIRTAQIQEDITITFPNNEGTAHRVANMTREYHRNIPVIKADNEVVSWGTVEFTRISGVKVTKTIMAADPLVFFKACHQIVSGTVSISTSNNRNWTINYGNGNCDGVATLTIDGKTKQIKLR